MLKQLLILDVKIEKLWRFMAETCYSQEQDDSSSRKLLLEEAKRHLKNFMKPAKDLYAKEYPRVLMLLGEPTDVVEKAFDEMKNSRLEQAEGTLLANRGMFYEVIGRTEEAIDCYKSALAIEDDDRLWDIKLAKYRLERLT